MSYLLDTDWAISALARRPTPAETLRRLMVDRIAVSRVTRAELYEGAFRSPNPSASLNRIRFFLSSFPTMEITDQVAERFAELRAHLKRHGELIGDFDLLIAATALQHELTLLTFNRRRFERVSGLRIFQAG